MKILKLVPMKIFNRTFNIKRLRYFDRERNIWISKHELNPDGKIKMILRRTDTEYGINQSKIYRALHRNGTRLTKSSNLVYQHE